MITERFHYYHLLYQPPALQGKVKKILLEVSARTVYPTKDISDKLLVSSMDHLLSPTMSKVGKIEYPFHKLQLQDPDFPATRAQQPTTPLTNRIKIQYQQLRAIAMKHLVTLREIEDCTVTRAADVLGNAASHIVHKTTMENLMEVMFKYFHVQYRQEDLQATVEHLLRHKDPLVPDVPDESFMTIKDGGTCCMEISHVDFRAMEQFAVDHLVHCYT